jgi:hypothetical protein
VGIVQILREEEPSFTFGSATVLRVCYSYDDVPVQAHALLRGLYMLGLGLPDLFAARYRRWILSL